MSDRRVWTARRGRTLRTKAARGAGALALGFACLTACEADQAPAQPVTPAQVAVPTAEPEVAPAQPEPDPEPEPEPELTTNCDVVVEGERRVERAMLHREREGFEDLEVVDGRRIKINCPPSTSSREGKLVAQLEAGAGGRSRQADIVSWDVALEAHAKPRVLKIEAAKHGPPPELNEEDAAELWPELEQDAYWDGEVDAGSETDGEQPEVAASEASTVPELARKPKPAAALVEVEFNAGRLKWAELRYEELARKRKKQVTLAPSAKRKLAAGRYKLSVRYPESSTDWEDAGELEIEAGKTVVSVKMQETPSLSAQITSAQ